MRLSFTQIQEREDAISIARNSNGWLAAGASGFLLLPWLETTVLKYGPFTLVLLYPNQRRRLLANVSVRMVIAKTLHRQVFATRHIGNRNWEYKT